jgi:outer membrane lipoprotein-sorting protein
MKRKAVFLTLLSALLTLPLLAQTSADTANTNTMTADTLIAKSIEARGGDAAIKAISSIRINGRMSMGGGIEAPFVMEQKRPNKMRIDFTVQGMTGTQAYDGTGGWFVMPFTGKTTPEKLPEDQLAMAKEQADFDGPLVDYKAKGHSVELVGKEDVEGTDAYKLKVTRDDGTVVYSYFDAEAFLELKATSKRKGPMGEMSSTTIYSDYKPVGGVLFPHSIEQVFEGAPAGQVITIDKIETNVDLPDDRFVMPAAEAPAPAGN